MFCSNESEKLQGIVISLMMASSSSAAQRDVWCGVTYTRVFGFDRWDVVPRAEAFSKLRVSAKRTPDLVRAVRLCRKNAKCFVE